MSYSDEEIIEQVLEGDKELFGILVERYQQPLFNLMLRSTHNRDEAADLTQDVFVRAFDKLWSFRSDKRFFPWLYSLAMNLAKDWQRKKRNHGSKQHIIEQESLEREDVDHHHTMIENREEVSLLQGALLDLSGQTREILLLRYRHGRPVREVAEIFDLSESAIKMRVKRGLEQLRGIMENKKKVSDGSK
jgi:RNA polymerase sigma-70 factor, ECF subfamily